QLGYLFGRRLHVIGPDAVFGVGRFGGYLVGGCLIGACLSGDVTPVSVAPRGKPLGFLFFGHARVLSSVGVKLVDYILLFSRAANRETPHYQDHGVTAPITLLRCNIPCLGRQGRWPAAAAFR